MVIAPGRDSYIKVMVVIAPKGRELPYKSNGGNRPGGGGGGGYMDSHIKVMVVISLG